ncbi:MAG: tRNA (adenosine(37)-N6)-threonylcarbamoyltransferase complex ATPase subunit type 1 TsaE [Bacteroidota bacterium]
MPAGGQIGDGRRKTAGGYTRWRRLPLADGGVSTRMAPAGACSVSSRRGRVDFSDLLPAETAGADETLALGRQLAERLEAGDVVALSGDLGAGKTHLVKGAAEAFGVDPAEVTSPTFTIVQEHAEGDLLHLDLYRIESGDDASGLGLADLLDGDAVVFVEWPERAAAWLPAHTIWLRLTHLGADHRRIEVASGPAA